MTIENQIVDFKTLMEHERVLRDEFRDKRDHDVGSYCLARFYNDTYCITFGVWHNGYGACPEIGLRNLKTNNFELHKQGGWREVARRFNRLARLIQGGRELNI